MRSLLTPEPDLSDEDLVELYRFANHEERVWVRAIFISSVDGSAQGPDGASASLSNRGDRRVFELQRSLCDVVLVGAGTARVEGYRPVTPSEVDVALRRRLGLADTPPIAVVSRSLSLDPSLLGPARAETIIVTTEDAPETTTSRALEPGRMIRSGIGAVDVAAVLVELGRRGLRRVLCEGGPSLLSALVSAGRLDDLCLTTAPTIVGGSGRRILQVADTGSGPGTGTGTGLDSAPRLRLVHLLEEDGSLFARYLVDPAA